MESFARTGSAAPLVSTAAAWLSCAPLCAAGAASVPKAQVGASVIATIRSITIILNAFLLRFILFLLVPLYIPVQV